jgi:hypothetical protein
MPSIQFNILNQKQSPALYSDILANRPAAGYLGRLFISTDTLDIYRDNGTTWDLISGVPAGVITGSGRPGQATFFTGTGAVSGNDNFWWDNTNHYLGLGTSTPGTNLDINGTNNVLVQLNSTTTGNSLVSFQNQGTGKWRLGNNYNAGANDFSLYDIASGVNRLAITNAGAATYTGSWTATSLAITGGTASQYLMANGTTSTLTNPVTGTGTEGVTSVFTGTGTIGNGSIFDNRNATGYAAYINFNSIGIGDLASTYNNYTLNVSSNGAPIIAMYSNAGNTATRNWAIAANNVAFGDLAFNQSNARLGDPISAATTRLYISPAGNIIVKGTTDAGYALDNAGTTRLQGAVTVGGLLTVNPSVTASGAIARGGYLTPTLTAAANNDVLVGLDVAPTYNTGAYTGVTKYDARFANMISAASIELTNSVYPKNGIYLATTNQIGININTNNIVNINANGIGANATPAGYGDFEAGTRIAIAPNAAAKYYYLGYNSNQANSRSWRFENDVISYGDFAIRQSTTKTGTSYQQMLLIDPSGNLSTLGKTTSTSFLSNGSITASSALAQGVYFNNTLTASANNDVLVGLDINATFTNGAYTGVSNLGIRIPAVYNNNVSTATITNGAFTNIVNVAGTPTQTGFVLQNKAGSNSSFDITLNATTANSVEFRFGTSGTPSARQTIYSSGNIGINTNTDAGYKLDINGTLRAQGIATLASRVNINGAVDNSVYSLNNNGNFFSYNIGWAMSTLSGTQTINGTGSYIYNGAGGDTWTLDNPSGNNKVYNIKNVGSGVLTIAAYSGTNIINNLAVSVTSITVAIGATVRLQHDGNIKTYQLQ